MTGGMRAQEQVKHIRVGQTITKAGKLKTGSKARHDTGENRLQNKPGNIKHNNHNTYPTDLDEIES